MPSVATSSSLAAPSVSASAVASDSFSKGGRNISIGDCALFKPPQDSLPFIGIIRRLRSGEEENLRLSVNWLYRPADAKLGKSALVEAAPNEVFYSFHEDEIPAASLLHPCKVAFLRKGVELPSGISSFVCRRVYDVENKCLWWLTDQDFTNERQKEVDHLLQNTQLDMHGAVQSGGRSPRGLNGTTGNQQLRSGSEGAQNINSHSVSSIKIKKREWLDQGSLPVKRELLSTTDDTNLGQFKADLVLKSEIAKITDRGGLVDYEGVEKLVQLMQPGSAEKKIDSASRMMLVDVIAVTDKFDCLGWFVQLRGLPVLDAWLQEVHKGKLGDGSNPKETNKSVDEFILLLLRALDKLPVNLHALQTCNVGKSVNHLRAHKNIEIQKKARSLVDMWKKRVEAEMNVLDSKSGSCRGSSWPTKSMLPEVSSMGNQHSGRLAEVIGKSSSAQTSGKIPCVKYGHTGESVAKVIATSPNSSKSIASSTRDPIPVTVTGSDPLSTIKEEKSSNSSHSQNSSQSCSSDHAKIVGSSCREDARSSNSGSVSGTKISVPSSRQRKSSYTFQGSALSVVQNETSFAKLSLNKNKDSEKVSPPAGTHERVRDAAVPDHGNSQQLIVRLPNTGRSPARGSDGGSYEDPTALSKSSRVARSGKVDYHDRKVMGKSDALSFNGVLKGDVEDKNVLIGMEEGNLSPPGAFCRDKQQSADTGEKLTEALKGTDLSSGYKPREGNLCDASFKSMNALVESCVKFSEASTTASGGDDMGMNLLASVAAGEMSRSDGSVLVSRGRNLPVPEESCSGNDVNSRHMDEDTARSEDPSGNGGSTLVQYNAVDLHIKCESDDAMRALADLSADNKASADSSIGISSEDAIKKEVDKSGGTGDFHDRRMSGTVLLTTGEDTNANHTNEKNVEDSSLKLPEVTASSKLVMKEAKGESPSFSSTEMRREEKSEVICTVSSCEILNEQKLPVTAKTYQESMVSKCTENALLSDSVSFKSMGAVWENTADMNAPCQIEQTEKQNDNFLSTVSDQIKYLGEKSDCDDEFLSKEASSVPLQQTDECVKLQEDEAGEPEMEAKLDFDLNEGFDVNDGCEEEIVKSPVRGNMSSAQLPCPLPLPSSSMSVSFPASIIVTSAAKGPFYPPENSFRGRGELGWKGSAATSAFHPAEPRKCLDTTIGSPVDSVVTKQGRPYLDIDLNVADEGDVDNESPGNTLALDLNRVDESHEVRKLSVNNSCKMGICRVLSKSSLPGGFPNAELNASRNFDLNSGPDPEDVSLETTPQTKVDVPFLSPLPSVRISSSDQGSLSMWFSQGNSYPPIAITPMLSSRGDQGYPIISAPGSQRIMGHPAGITSFVPDFHRGPVLSSSPALPFPTNVSFQYSFPFETDLPMPSLSYPNTSTAYPSISSQLVGPSGVLPTHYRAYMMNIPGGATNTGVDNQRWTGQALDLNSGPGNVEVEHRNERSSSALRQSIVPGSQAFSADEQLRMYQMTSGSLKRKDPDGGRDGDPRNYKQLPPWS